MIDQSLPKNAARSGARERMLLVLKEAEERYRRELMGENERLMLHDQIVRLKIRLVENA